MSALELSARPSIDHRPAPRSVVSDDPLERRRLIVTTGLAALSLDAMASVAYGPEAIVIVLAAAGSHAIGYTFAVSAAIVALLTVLVLSYRQLIAAFPDGGGAYAVSKKYLGRHAPLVAAASLVLDYVLNVAVSVAAGTAALTSAVPATRPYTVWIALGVLLLITVVNLRGIVSSARLFIVPTVIFVVAIMSVIVVGLITGGHAQPAPAPATGALTTVGVLLLLKAFANGCAALTGVEAIANATPQFRENRIRRAQRAYVALGVVLGVMMLGVSALVVTLHIAPRDGETVLSQIAEGVFGRGFLYYVVQTATLVLLALAANTSFGGLPQLMKVVAADDYLPHRLTRRSATGVYREGVLALAITAAVLIIVTDGNVNMLVPLFAIGVFIGFTLAQAGLVRHWFVQRAGGWRWRAALNGLGATMTGLAAVVVTVMKADEGSLWVMVVLVALVVAMLGVSRSYRHRRAAQDDAPIPVGTAATQRHSFAGRGIALVPVAANCAALDQALRQANAFAREVRAVHVHVDGDDREAFRADWRTRHPIVPLVELAARDADSVIVEIVSYVDRIGQADDVLVVIPDPESPTRARLLSAGRADDLQRLLGKRTSALVTRARAARTHD